MIMNAIKAIAERTKLGYQIYGLESEKFLQYARVRSNIKKYKKLAKRKTIY